MKIKQLAAVLGAAVLIGNCASVAQAASVPPSPLHLDEVEISPSSDINNRFAYDGLVTVAFSNRAAIPVTKVVFDVMVEGKVIGRLVDVGTVLPGKSVKHTFGETEDDSQPNQHVAVESVTFSDGTRWEASAQAELLP